MEEMLILMLGVIALLLLLLPVLVGVALVRLAAQRRRIEALELEVAALDRRVEAAHQGATSMRPDTRQSSAPAWEHASTPAVAVPPSATPGPGAASAPSVQTAAPQAAVPSSSAAAPVAAASPLPARTSGPAVFDGPETPSAAAARETQSPAPPPSIRPSVPPPLPPRPSAPPMPGTALPPRTPPTDPLAPLVRWVRHFFTEGNVPVKVGVLVLLAGVAALLKYLTDQGLLRVSMELRLAGIAAAAIGALVFAWRQREDKRVFSLAVQGGAIGTLMLVVFAAFKLYGFIDAGPGFALTIVLVTGLGVLAVLQRSLALVVFGVLAGFMAPIWLSTGSGNHVALFSYYAVLDVAIFAVAWAQSRGRGPWRLLNLLGFVFTFGIGTLWGVLDYVPGKYASTQPFLILFFVLFLLIPVFYARSRGGDRRDAVDGTLVFGTPLVSFMLQAGLLEGRGMPLAFSALALAAIYALLAALLRRRGGYSQLVPAYAVLAVGFATLAVPLALSARATAGIFALEGAALVWLGLRQQRRLPQASGLALQVLAAIAYIAGARRAFPDDIARIAQIEAELQSMAQALPVLNGPYMSALLIALAGIVTAWVYRRRADVALVAVFTVWGLGWWSFAGLQEIDRFVPNRSIVDAVLGFVVLSLWLCAEGWRRERELPALAWAAALGLCLGAPLALVQSAEHAHPLVDWGAAAWVAFVALGARALVCLREAGVARGLAYGGWAWALTALLACLLHEAAESAVLGNGWKIAAILLPLLLHAALWLRRADWVRPRPGAGFAPTVATLGIVAAVGLTLAWGLSLSAQGGGAPLPWLPVLNPLELIQLAALALGAIWLRAHRVTAPRAALGALAAVTFVWITFATLRSAHHWGGASWSPSMLGDTVVQTSLTVVWSVLGVLGWVFGSRRGDRLLWAAGAGLMGIVLVKLILIDRGHLGNLFGIVSFLAYGLLCTVVGYFAPAPPKAAVRQEEVSA